MLDEETHGNACQRSSDAVNQFEKLLKRRKKKLATMDKI